MESKKWVKWSALGLGLLILVSGFVYLGWRIATKQASYYAVYFETGEIYFGKFRAFPVPSLSDVWILQGDAENRLALNPLSASVWQPKTLKLNPFKIVFLAKVSDDSPVVRTIRQGVVAATPTPSQLPSPETSPAPEGESGSGINQ